MGVETDDAIRIRDHVVKLAAAEGKWETLHGGRILRWIHHPFDAALRMQNDLAPQPDPSPRTSNIAVEFGAVTTRMPYGLWLWANKTSVFSVEWNDVGTVRVETFERGEWEADLLALGT